MAGPDGLEYLVYGTRHPTEIGWLPRSRAVRFGWPWVDGRTDDPWDREAEAPPLAYGEPAARPPNILNVDEVERESARPTGSMTSAPLATEERSDQAGFHWEQLAPGSRGSPSHCHSEEEEIFVILDGDATLELWPAPVARGAEREDIPLRPGHVIARPPGSRVGHAFRAARTGRRCSSTARGARTTWPGFPARTRSSGVDSASSAASSPSTTTTENRTSGGQSRSRCGSAACAASYARPS